MLLRRENVNFIITHWLSCHYIALRKAYICLSGSLTREVTEESLSTIWPGNQGGPHWLKLWANTTSVIDNEYHCDIIMSIFSCLLLTFHFPDTSSLIKSRWVWSCISINNSTTKMPCCLLRSCVVLCLWVAIIWGYNQSWPVVGQIYVPYALLLWQSLPLSQCNLEAG